MVATKRDCTFLFVTLWPVVVALVVGFADRGRGRRIMSWRPAWATHFNCLSYWLRKNLTEAPEEKEGFSLAHDFMVSIMMGKS